MPWPAVGVVGGAEACTIAQPATGGGSRRSRRCCFGGWSKKIRDGRNTTVVGLTSNGYVC